EASEITVTVHELCEETMCPICLDYFRDPLTIAECGHNFCQACLSQYSGESDVQASCPQCRGTFQKRNLRPNRQLARIVEIARKLGEQEVKVVKGKGQVCKEHQEPLKLFCRDHKAPICVVCDKAKEHEGHKVVPLEEASQELTPFLAPAANSCLSTLSFLQNLANTQREETVAQSRRMHQLLEKQEKRHLAQVDELEKEIARKGEDHLARLYRELSSLEGIMRKLRCSSLLFLFSFLPLSLSIPTANVTLDPDTAHPCLLLSEDHKTVRMGHKMQKVPDNPKRFSYYTFVLGREGFTAGRHSWEVRVGSEGAWAVGVTRESVDRKGLVYFCPEDGFWVLLYSQGTYEACIDPSSALPVSGEPKTIRVSLNCDGGWVAFHDADRGSLLYVFSGVSFAGETLFPFFYVGDDALLTISS
uniref:Uncharacterized protein n=1 Tax=Varanus komodoensis TaxID=61221 RepID=A0A8D2JBB7_VARKO